MQKIPTMFERDEAKPGHPVTDRIKPDCQWVLDGEGVPTVKLDGTNVKVEAGQLFKRQKPKDRDYDEAAYVPCDRANPADRWAFEAFDAGLEKRDAVYELVGPKVQGNPYALTRHQLVRVVPPDADLVLPSWGHHCPPLDSVSFASLRAYLTAHPIEGLVFHHPDDGRLAKIKRRDFGLPWPADTIKK